MYTYSIFSVKPEIASHYFYKSSIIYRFLREFKKNPNYNYLQLQYKYATSPLDIATIAAYMRPLDVEIEKRELVMKLYWDDKSITIHEDDRHLEITCESIADIEEFFFPVLRNSPLHYFVISNQMNDYGWLAVKNNRLMNNQLLYSI